MVAKDIVKAQTSKTKYKRKRSAVRDRIYIR
jgi:hypothetical protein